MSKSLILAEKPSVAVTLAKTLKANNRYDGYFEGENYVVTFAFGHLLELYDTKDYSSDMEIWELDNFPFIPDKFKYKIKNDNGAIKQFKIIKKLTNRNDIDLIINAADNDREGELLATLILNATGTTKPIKRILRNEWTPHDIKEGLNNLKNNSEMVTLQDAGSARQLADWLIGINFTSVATLKYSDKKTLNLGRVIAPVVNLIYERDMSIKNFKPVPYFEVKAIFKADKGQYEGFYINNNNTKINDKATAQNIVNNICNKPGVITSKTVKHSKEGPNKLFNLISLQGYMTSKYNNWTADKVLNVLQKLYEGKEGIGGYVTYPRTSSKYLTTSKINQTKIVLNNLIKNQPFQNLVKFIDSKTIFDDSKVDSHGAIIPTYIIPNMDDLTDDEKLLYEEIKLRFISQFMPKAEYENTEILTKVEDYTFKTKGKVLKNKGWLELYNTQYKDDLLPELKVNSFSEVQHSQILNKKTEPPKHYTEQSLLSTMENCGKNIENEDNILSGFTIGTPATSSDILKKIQKVGYVKKKGKSLYITDVGINLVETIPIKQLFDVNFTGMLEKQLKDIEKGKLTKQVFLSKIIDFTKDGVNKMKNDNNVNISKEKNVSLGKCPECGSDIIENTKTFNCSNKDCNFVVFKNDKFLNKFNVNVTSKIVKKLLSKEDVILFNLKSQKGNYFDAKLELFKTDKGYWNFRFNFDFEKEIIGKCPECGSDVIETGRGFQCSNKSCKFILWHDDKYLAKFKKKMTKSIAKSFLSKGEANIKGLVSKKGNKFDATIKLFKDDKGYWSYKFDFN